MIRLIAVLFGILLISSISVASVYAAHHGYSSPRQQMADGVAAEDVICKKGMELMVKSNGKAACVKPSTATKLSGAGWGAVIEETRGVYDPDEHMDDHTDEKDTTSDEMKMEEQISIDVSTMVPESEKTMVHGIDISMASPVLGSEDAPITIVEFGDFQCPKCKQWYDNEKPTIMSDYIDTGDVKLYFVDFTFLGDDSITAAQGAHCANDQGEYWAMHDIIYENQGNIQSGWAQQAGIEDLALNLQGIKIQTLLHCIQDESYVDTIAYNKQVGLDNGVEATPVFFIIAPDGTTEEISGPQPASVFSAVIDEMLESIPQEEPENKKVELRESMQMAGS